MKISYIILKHFLLILSVLIKSQLTLEHRSDDITLIMSEILKKYDVRLRPNFGADPLYIGIDMTISTFNQISEVNMDFTITIFLNQYWKDERLAFSTGDEILTFTGDFAKKIWVPDIFFPADKDSFIHDVTEKNLMVRLQGDGSIMYGMRFTSRQSCQMDLRNYPLDSQNCTVEIESYGYTVRDVVMYWKENPILGVEHLKLPQFKITKYDTTDRIESLATGVYQRLTLSFKLERNFGFFFFQMYLPSILIVMLSQVSFWIHNDATAARVALGITTVLTMTTINNSVRSSLPRISYIKAIDIYLVMCFLFVFAALIEFAAVNYILHKEKKMAKKFSAKKENSRTSKFSKFPRLKLVLYRKPEKKIESKGVRSRKKVKSLELGIKDKNNLRTSIEECEESENSEPEVVISSPMSLSQKNSKSFIKSVKEKSRKKLKKVKIEDVSSVDSFSRIFFPLTFLLFNFIYWSVYVNIK